MSLQPSAHLLDMKTVCSRLPDFSLDIPAEVLGHGEVGGVVAVWKHLIPFGGEGFAAVFRQSAELHDLPRFGFLLRSDIKDTQAKNKTLQSRLQHDSEKRRLLTLIMRIDSIPRISIRQLMMTGVVAVIMSNTDGYSE